MGQEVTIQLESKKCVQSVSIKCLKKMYPFLIFVNGMSVSMCSFVAVCLNLIYKIISQSNFVTSSPTLPYYSRYIYDCLDYKF